MGNYSHGTQVGDTVAEIQFSHLKEGTLRESNGYIINPVNITQLTGSAEVDFVWDGYAARGHITLLNGIWKGGKSTLLGHLFRNFADGGELGTAVSKAKVLVLTEESNTQWIRRKDTIGIGENVEIVSRPFFCRPSQDKWERALDEIKTLSLKNNYDVVVFDPLASLWPVSKENDAGQVMSALMPLHAITATGAAVILCHHPRKSQGDGGQSARGSGALTGFVDVILEFGRMDSTHRSDTRRVLRTFSRFDESPDEIVLDLTPSGYVTCGTKADASQSDRIKTILDILSSSNVQMTTNEIHDRWIHGDIPKPSIRTLQNDLSSCCEDGRVSRFGAGRKGDPHRFCLQNAIPATPLSIGAGIESAQSNDNANPGNPDGSS